MLFGFPPYFPMLFRVAKLPKEVGRCFYTGSSLQGPWKLAARLRLLEERRVQSRMDVNRPADVGLIHAHHGSHFVLPPLALLFNYFSLGIVFPKGETAGDCLVSI